MKKILVGCLIGISLMTFLGCETAKEEKGEKIKENVCNGDVVLLSPASASWDQYDKFETRGEDFKNIVAKIFK